jgi:sec-independent protein translocase protein TatC
MRRIKPVDHEERLSVVDHLDELRSRLMVSAAAFLVALGLAGWQNGKVIALMNAPLPGDLEPITLGPSEPFMTTLKLSAYAALILALPVLLYQVYAFAAPALPRAQRRLATLLVLSVPTLFLAGVVFCYLVVLTPALHFLLNFNADQFNTQLRASDYYDFATLTMVAMGLGFQVPIGVVVLTRLGVVSVDQLRGTRRYAIFAIALIAALLPTLDPVTLMLEMVPLLALYEGGIQLARLFEPDVSFADRARLAED